MNNTIEVIRDIRALCTHDFEGGHRCASPALRGETFCYYHHPTRKRVSNPNERRARRIARQAFNVPLPTSQLQLQYSLNEVIRRIANNQIDIRRARLLVGALQIAAKGLRS
jgi:hypothetical protein